MQLFSYAPIFNANNIYTCRVSWSMPIISTHVGSLGFLLVIYIGHCDRQEAPPAGYMQGETFHLCKYWILLAIEFVQIESILEDPVVRQATGKGGAAR